MVAWTDTNKLGRGPRRTSWDESSKLRRKIRNRFDKRQNRVQRGAEATEQDPNHDGMWLYSEDAVLLKSKTAFLLSSEQIEILLSLTRQRCCRSERLRRYVAHLKPVLKIIWQFWYRHGKHFVLAIHPSRLARTAQSAAAQLPIREASILSANVLYGSDNRQILIRLACGMRFSCSAWRTTPRMWVCERSPAKLEPEQLAALVLAELSSPTVCRLFD